MARILLAPLGSHGDVHPFVAIGLALQARGHDVYLITSEHFRPLAERAGLSFVPVGTEADFQKLIHNPDLWHPSRSLKAIYGDREWTNRLLRDGYEAIENLYRPGETVVAAGALGFGARVAHDKLGVPLATVHLQPAVLVSVAKPPVFASLRMRSWWPRWARRFVYWWADRLVDRMVGPPLNAYRLILGLPPVRRVFSRWMNSPQLVLNLFPDWFGSAPDWPAQARNTGFVRYDQAETSLAPDVEAFLAVGEAPLVFTFGSAMRQGKPFFAAAVEACRLLGRRGLLLCQGREQAPDALPPDMMHVDYAPFSRVFPRAAAIVHHGGIGTTAQGLAAGVPQLVMPLAFDQPDNADRLERLGVGQSLLPKRFTGPNAAAALRPLLASREVQETCRAIARHVAATDPLAETCAHIEALVGRDKSILASPAACGRVNLSERQRL